jgi:mono/diheme cytochrome c family protein
MKPTNLAPLLALSALIALTTSTTTSASDDQPIFSNGRRFEQRSGEAIYRSICQGCHMPNGQGAEGAGAYPKLANNVRLGGAPYPIIVVLNGRKNMPSFARALDDAQVAAVVGFIRTNLGNNYGDAVTADQVAALRAQK